MPSSVWLTGCYTFWKDGHYGQGVLVGVVDSGIDHTHPVLQGRVIKRRDYTNESDVSSSEYNGHGTHVASTIGALPGPEPEDGLVGVAPGVRFCDYRVFPRKGGASNSVIAQAVRDAVTDGCHVINLSLGGPVPNSDLEVAIKEARAQGVSVICAGGNMGMGSTPIAGLAEDEVSYPAYYPGTLAVACVDLNLSSGDIDFVSFSNTNGLIDVAADGYRLVGAWPGKQYVTISGTSMACPCVAGMAALLYGRIAERSGPRVARSIDLHAVLKAEAVDVFDESGERNNIEGYGLCTLFSEVPKLVDGKWVLPTLAQGAPAL